MKPIIGTLAYLVAIAIVFLAVVFDDVAWPITTGAVVVLVMGALWAWTDPPAAAPARCDCSRCEDKPTATADDVR
jgi:hypothetical protein